MAQTATPAAKDKESAGAGVQRRAVAKEISDQPAGPPRPNIVWRKNESASKDSRLDGIAGSAPMVVARQSAASTTHVARSPGDPATESQPASDLPPGGGINDDIATDHVIRALYRRLAVERERRGIE
jgi:hypothetical protein